MNRLNVYILHLAQFMLHQAARAWHIHLMPMCLADGKHVDGTISDAIVPQIALEVVSVPTTVTRGGYRQTTNNTIRFG